ncbi:MAG: FGGY family carbohydrate kinase [Cyanobacteriota bacterium]
MWDPTTGKRFSNAIVWQDRRTAPLRQELIKQEQEPNIQQRTGLVLDAYFVDRLFSWIPQTT